MKVEGTPVTVPTPVAFSTVPPGGVICDNTFKFYLSCGGTTTVNLANGAINSSVPPTTEFYYFPGASLQLT